MRCATRVEYSPKTDPRKSVREPQVCRLVASSGASPPLNLLTHVMVHLWFLLLISILYGEVKCLVYTSPTFPFKFLFLFEI